MKAISNKKTSFLERKSWKTSNPVDLISAMINQYMVTYVARDKWLTDKEHLFLICCVLVKNEGVEKYTSSRAKFIFKEMMNIERASDITGLLTRMSLKKWMKWDKNDKSFNVPEFFNNLNLDKHKVKINVEMELV